MITLIIGALMLIVGILSTLGLLNIIPIPLPRKYLIYGTIFGLAGAAVAALLFVGFQRIRGMLIGLIGGSSIPAPTYAGTYTGPTVPSTTGTGSLPVPTAGPFDFAALFESDGTLTVLSRQEAIDLFSIRMQAFVSLLSVTLDNYYQARNNVASLTQQGLQLFTPSTPIAYKPVIKGSQTDIQLKWGRGTKTTTVQIMDVPCAWGYSQDQLSAAATYASDIIDAMAFDLQRLMKTSPVLLLPRALPTATSGARLLNDGQFSITVEPKSDLVTRARRAIGGMTSVPVSTIIPDSTTLSTSLQAAQSGQGGPVRFAVDLVSDAKAVYNKHLHDFPVMASPEFASRVLSGQYDSIARVAAVTAHQQIAGGLTRTIDSKQIAVYFLTNLVQKVSWLPTGSDLDHVLTNGLPVSTSGKFTMPDMTPDRPGAAPSAPVEWEITYQVSANNMQFAMKEVPLQ